MIREETYKHGEVIIREGDHGSEAYIITKGRVVVSRSTNDRNYVLAGLEEGEIFGEMGLIEDTARSATVTALSDVTVISIDRDGFNYLFQHDPAVLLPILKALFERLRTMNRRLSAYHASSSRESEEQEQCGCSLEGASSRAKEALEGKIIEIDRFPFKVGRWSEDEKTDVFYDNDLAIRDQRPYYISRNHFSITRTGNHFAVVDRGSRLGTIVNGKRIGGKEKQTAALLSHTQVNEIKIGSKRSPYVFLLSIHACETMNVRGAW